MLVRYRSRSFALKGGLLALAFFVFLSGLGTRLSLYQANQDKTATIKVRLGVDKQPDLTPIHCSQLQATQEDLGFSVFSSYCRQETPSVADALETIERMGRMVPARPAYDPHLPQLAYRPPPVLS